MTNALARDKSQGNGGKRGSSSSAAQSQDGGGGGGSGGAPASTPAAAPGGGAGRGEGAGYGGAMGGGGGGGGSNGNSSSGAAGGSRASSLELLHETEEPSEWAGSVAGADSVQIRSVEVAACGMRHGAVWWGGLAWCDPIGFVHDSCVCSLMVHPDHDGSHANVMWGPV